MVTGIKNGTQRALRLALPCIVVLLWASQLPAQAAAEPQQASGSVDQCSSSLIPEMEHADALRRVCAYATALPRQLPKFTCEQVTTRSFDNQTTDVITATVGYENGKEFYREIKSKGAAADAKVLNAGVWSTGQFGGDINSLFEPANKITFQFANEREIDGRKVLTFQYQVPRQSVAAWRLQDKDQSLTPPFHGQIRIDAKSGHLLVLLIAASEMPRTFRMRSAEVQIKYGEVDFGDGTAFVLPVESVLNVADRKGRQSRNELEFRDCHKFRATTQVKPAD
jgi:hypothetical protein